MGVNDLYNTYTNTVYEETYEEILPKYFHAMLID